MYAVEVCTPEYSIDADRKSKHPSACSDRRLESACVDGKWMGVISITQPLAIIRSGGYPLLLHLNFAVISDPQRKANIKFIHTSSIRIARNARHLLSQARPRTAYD